MCLTSRATTAANCNRYVPSSPSLCTAVSVQCPTLTFNRWSAIIRWWHWRMCDRVQESAHLFNDESAEKCQNRAIAPKFVNCRIGFQRNSCCHQNRDDSERARYASPLASYQTHETLFIISFHFHYFSIKLKLLLFYCYLSLFSSLKALTISHSFIGVIGIIGGLQLIIKTVGKRSLFAGHRQTRDESHLSSKALTIAILIASYAFKAFKAKPITVSPEKVWRL